jgi:hypothetical protein
MSEKEKKEESAAMYRVETVPPPAGESDAYNAPTKVGPMPAATIAAMMQEAERHVAENNARAAKKVAAATPPIPREEPESEPKVKAAAPEPPTDHQPIAPPQELPKIYDDADDEDRAATLLSTHAKPPPTPPTSSPHIDEVAAANEKDAPLAPPTMTALRTDKQTDWVSWVLVALIAALAVVAVWWLKHHGR